MSVGKVLGLGCTILFVAGCQSWQYRDIESLPPTAAVPETSEPGKVEVRYFDGIGGTLVSDLTATTQFPDNPDVIAELTELRVPGSRADNYGSLVRGFITPPVDGDYRFFVSGDDETELWLSTSDQPEDARTIASVPRYASPGFYEKYSSQTSGLIQLSATNSYYFEIRHKEGSGGDHFEVAWEGPGLSQQIVNSAYISSWAQSLTGGTEVSGGESYSLGYRVGFLDGSEGLSFNQTFPPLDQDQDGLYDNWEIVHGLNPSDASDATSDPDQDLLAAADEFLIGTAEGNPDSDNDGIADGVEYAYGLDPLDSADASGDLDNDGYTNLEEYVAGTELKDADDSPAPAPAPEPEPEPETTPETGEIAYVTGFAGQYFSGTNFERLLAVQVDETVDFNWGNGAPIPESPDDNFSVRWSGIFTAPHASGTNDYEFSVRTNDGVRLYANGELVINDWSSHAPTTFTYNRSMNSGEELRLTIEYYEGTGTAVAQYSARNLSTNSNVDTASTIISPDMTQLASVDSDSDGIPDTWELQYGLNAWIPDADGVNNDSGISNIEAYESGLDPYTLTNVSGDSSQTTAPETSEPAPSETGGTVTLTWTAPSTRMDGSSIALSEIDYYVINYGQDVANLDQSVNVGGGEDNYTFSNLKSGTWYFTIRVVDTNGLSSAPSEPVSAEVP